MKVISFSTCYGSKMKRDVETGTTKGRRVAKSPESLVASHSGVWMLSADLGADPADD
jgi:hypothetical protein